MATSQEKTAIMKAVRKHQAKFKSTRPHVLSEDQYEKLHEAFYKYAKENGWYADLYEAITENGKYFWFWQKEVVDEVLRSVFQKRGFTIAISIKRQEGKTEIMALLMIFCYENYYKTFGDPFAVGVVGPGKVVSNNVFIRLRNYLLSQSSALFIDKADYKESLSGDSLTAISISETGGTTIEGKTLNFLLRDESHEGSDKRWRDEVLWTTASIEGATIVMLGTAGYRKCDYKAILDQGTDETTKVHLLNYDVLSPYMKELGEKGLKIAAGWEKRTEKLARMNGGWDSPETRKNLFCEWQDGDQTYITREKVEDCLASVSEYDGDEDGPLFAFLDLGYSGDRSWAVLMNKKKEVVDIIMLKDANETMALRDQLELFLAISDEKDYTSNYEVIGIDKTGLGIGAYEMLTEMSPCTVHPIAFSGHKKHQMYINMRNHMITGWKEDRIILPKHHIHVEMLIEELINIEQTPTQLGILKFHAAQTGPVVAYDDLPDALGGCLEVVITYYEHFENKPRYKKRTSSASDFKKRLEANKIRAKKTKRRNLLHVGIHNDW